MTKRHPKSSSSLSCGSDCSSQELSLPDSSFFLKNILDYITDELVIIDEQGRFIYVNDAAVQGIGYSRSHILKKKVVDFLNEKISVTQWKKRHFDVLKRRKTPISYRIERVSRSKDVRTLDITAVYLPGMGKDMILSFGKDVTRQVHLKHALEESKNLYHFLAEGASDGIVALDAGGKFIYANHAFQNMIGLPEETYQGLPFLKFVPQASRAKLRQLFAHSQQSGQPVHEVIDILSPEASAIPIEVKITPVVKAGHAATTHIIARDLRPRQKLEAMERQAEKMDALRHFISGTAQELKNPLMGVVHRTTVLLNKYAQRDFEYISYREFQDMISTLGAIKDQVQYCYETTQRLTAMGQKKQGLSLGIVMSIRFLAAWLRKRWRICSNRMFMSSCR